MLGPPAMTAPAIFISYRRDDSAGHARAVCEALNHRLGADRVFMDVDDIVAGQSFEQALVRAVTGALAVLVLIGPRWAGPRDGGRPPRLADADDHVRREVQTALDNGLPVIPLLVAGATMPAADSLPEPLRPLALRQAVVIDHRSFGTDVDRLAAELHQQLGAALPPPEPPAPPPRRGLLAAGALLLAGGSGGLGWWAGRRTSAGTPAAPPAPERAAVNGRWTARVVYDWPGAAYDEAFEFEGSGQDLFGSASYLRGRLGLLEGRVDGDRLQFVTRSRQTLGTAEREVTHRYRGQLVGERLEMVLQTEGAFTPHVPVKFSLQRARP